MIISDSFCGYLTHHDERFAYTVSNQHVTLLSTKDDMRGRIESVERICNSTEELPEFMYAEDNGFPIAFMRKSAFRRSSISLNCALRFTTPLIIKAAGNADGFFNQLTVPWNKFHAITFVGGNINALCNPQIAVQKQSKDDDVYRDGANEIKVLPWNDYSRSIVLLIGGEKTTITISVKQNGGRNDKERKGAFVLGELNTFIRFSFNQAKEFDSIEKYYVIAKSLVSLLTLQDNVTFDVYLSQKDNENLLFPSAVCKIFDHYSNYSVRNEFKVIPLYEVFNQLPDLINLIDNNEIDALLSLLPNDNGRVNSITVSNVQDLCTALEVAYGWEKKKREKDELIEELKKIIKNSISDFMDEHPDIDVNRSTTISSAFQYLDFTLKDKIMTLYHENPSVANIVSKKYALPLLSEENIAAFVKLRNSRAHRGKTEWGDSAEIYPVLLAIEYACVLKHIGVPRSTIDALTWRLF